MHRSILHVVLLLVLAGSSLAQQEPLLKSYGALAYPPIARAARVSGEVIVEFSINAGGETTAVTATEGPKLLRGSAESFVQSWRFAPGGAVWDSETKFKTTIRYKAIDTGAVDPRIDPDLTVRSDSFHRFEATILVGGIELSKCPTGADEDVRQESTRVILSRFPGLGATAPVRLIPLGCRQMELCFGTVRDL